MSMSEYSLSDLAAVGGGGGGIFGGGSSGAGVLIILFLIIAMMGGGLGGFGNTASTLTSNDLQRAIDLNSIQTGQANISADIQRGIYEVTGSTKDAAYNNLGEIRDVQSAVATNGANIINALTALQNTQQSCCCTTQRAIDGVNYNLATQSAAIQANDTANTQKILDALAQNKIDALQSQINQLQLTNAVAGVVRYPTASTYCSGTNPFATCNCGSTF